jgi:hypothetical protein
LNATVFEEMEIIIKTNLVRLLHVWDPLVDAVVENAEWRATLMDWRWPVVGAVTYLVVIFVISRLFATNRTFLRWAVAGHNLLLCALSFIMAVQTTFEGSRLWLGTGNEGQGGRPFSEHYCDASRHGSLGFYGLEEAAPGRLLTGRVWFWCVVFYLSKYYELIDTVLLAARGRPMAFLHVYHHIIIIPLVLAFIQAEIAYFWVGVVFNATIHTFMYYYYFMDSLGYKLWWKSHLTKAQIFQFCWGIFTWWPFPVVCGYSWTSLEAPMLVFWFNQVVLLSFLFLFVRFYLRTYSARKLQSSQEEKRKAE